MATTFNNYLDEQRDEYINIYGDIADKVFNPQMLLQFNDTKHNPIIIFDLLDKLYCELALIYKLDYNIRIEKTSVVFSLDSEPTFISIEVDDYDDKTYIKVSDFNLPKDKINKLNEAIRNRSYFRNGYRVIKTLEVVCKCWGFNGIKYTHIVKPELASNLRAEGYDNIYKLRGKIYFPDQDYVKWMLNDDEINKKYQIEYELKKPSSFKSILVKKFKNIVSR